MRLMVIGPVAVVRLGDSDVMIEHGGMIPDGVDEKVARHLVDVGLAEQVDDPDRPEGK